MIQILKSENCLKCGFNYELSKSQIVGFKGHEIIVYVRANTCPMCDHNPIWDND